MNRIKKYISDNIQLDKYKAEWNRKRTIEKVLLIIIILIMGMKPISDMLYFTHILDIILLGLAVLAAPITMYVAEYKFGMVDIIPILWLVLCVISLVMSGGNTVWFTWIKVMSVFPIYILGKNISENDERLMIKAIQISLLIVLIANLITILIGQGYKEWAYGAQTFSGLYYFKTDLALAMAQVTLFFIIDEKLNVQNYIILIVAALLALLSNSRIYFAIGLLLIGICGIWGHTVRKKLKFIKIALVMMGVLVISVILLTILARIPFFKERNFISFTMEGTLWETLVYNLMYRNVIWKEVLDYFFKGDLLHVLFGKGFTYDIPWYDAHSLYVSTIYKFGVVGTVALGALVFWAWRVIRDYSEGQMYFLNIGLWTILLVAGISYTTGESTQYTWLVAMFMGCISAKKSKEITDGSQGRVN